MTQDRLRILILSIVHLKISINFKKKKSNFLLRCSFSHRSILPVQTLGPFLNLNYVLVKLLSSSGGLQRIISWASEIVVLLNAKFNY